MANDDDEMEEDAVDGGGMDGSHNDWTASVSPPSRGLSARFNTCRSCNSSERMSANARNTPRLLSALSRDVDDQPRAL